MERASGTSPINFTSPCPYVPLDKYRWALPYFNDSPGNCPRLLWNPVFYTLTAAFHGLAYGLGIELTFEIFLTFKKWTTLYFWTLLISIWSTIFLTIGYELMLFTHFLHEFIIGIIATGGILTDLSFNLILYSRLNLLTQNKTFLRVVLLSIAITTLIGNVPIIVEASVSRIVDEKILRKIGDLQSIFLLEGFILSSIYVYLFWKFIQDLGPKHRHARSTLRLLILTQVIVLALDLVPNVLQWMEYTVPICMITTLRYALKIKIEFVILNRLVKFSQLTQSSGSHAFAAIGDEAHPEPACHNPTFLTPPALNKFTKGNDASDPEGTAIQPTHTTGGNQTKWSADGTKLSRTFSRSLPDLSFNITCDETVDLEKNADNWNITDMKYLGRSSEAGESRK